MWRRFKERVSRNPAMRKEMPQARNFLRARLEGLLLSDHVSEELKEMAEVESGCVFAALVHVLRHFDSPALKTPKAQKEYIVQYKKLFGSLAQSIQIVDIFQNMKVVLPGLAVERTEYLQKFHYDFDDACFEDIPLVSIGSVDAGFDTLGEGIPIPQLDPDHSALLFLRDINRSAHCMALNDSELLSGGLMYGREALEAYLRLGYVVFGVCILKRSIH